MRKTDIALKCAYGQMVLVTAAVALLAASLLNPALHDVAAIASLIVFAGYVLEDLWDDAVLHSAALFFCGLAYWAENPLVRTAFTLLFFFTALRMLRRLLKRRARLKVAREFDRKMRSFDN